MMGEITTSNEKERQCLLHLSYSPGAPFDNSLPTVTIIGKKAYFGDRLMSWSSNAKSQSTWVQILGLSLTSHVNLNPLLHAVECSRLGGQDLEIEDMKNSKPQRDSIIHVIPVPT